MTVQALYELIDRFAPFATQADGDNSGFLVGSASREVTGILFALDVTEPVIDEAVSLGAQLIVTHHPLMFHSRKNMLEEDLEGKILCEMIRNHLSMIAAHTNLDKTDHSGSACCAAFLKLQNIRQEGYLFFGELPKPMPASALESVIAGVLHFPVRRYGSENKLVSTLAIGGGACDEEWLEAKQGGAQAFLTGEVRHHNALAASMDDFVLFDGGHYGTEAPLVPVLAEYLQKQLDDVQCNVKVYPSQSEPFGRM